MANQWFKFYGGEFLSDPKIQDLTGNERSCWVTILSLASTSTTAGKIEFLSLQSLLRMSGVEMITNDNEMDVIMKFQKLKMIRKNNDGSIQVTNWEKRQERSMTPYERVKKYRENKAKTVNDNEMITHDNANDNSRIEEKRIEENRIIGRTLTKKPSIDEVSAYCKERGNSVNPQKWFDHYQSNGWKVGKNTMKDWKASVRTWEKNDYSPQGKKVENVLVTGHTSKIIEAMQKKAQENK